MDMDDELRKQLALWRVKPEIPPDFQRGVWSRIAARELKLSNDSLSGALSWNWLTQPRLAVFALVLGGFTGAAFGLVESGQANTRNWKVLEAKYVQSVDPYQHLGTY
jgi:hypothetical protein